MDINRNNFNDYFVDSIVQKQGKIADVPVRAYVSEDNAANTEKLKFNEITLRVNGAERCW